MIRSHILVICAGCLLLAARGAAQNALYVEHRKAFSLVQNVYGSQPYVEENGRRILATGHNYILKKVDEYAPALISVRHLEVATINTVVFDSGTRSTPDFSFTADFESSYKLDHVFIVLDLNTDDPGKLLFIREVGTLVPHETKTISVRLPSDRPLEKVHYRVHVFVNGFEVFHSLMAADFVERTLDRMVARRIQGVTDAAPKPFVGPPPEYPPQLRQSRVSGEAIIQLVIAPNGRVVDPKVTRASEPAFGEAALAVARQWRFLPKVSGGHAVSTQAEIPFLFPPDKPAPKS